MSMVLLKVPVKSIVILTAWHLERYDILTPRVSMEMEYGFTQGHSERYDILTASRMKKYAKTQVGVLVEESANLRCA